MTELLRFAEVHPVQSFLLVALFGCIVVGAIQELARPLVEAARARGDVAQARAAEANVRRASMVTYMRRSDVPLSDGAASYRRAPDEAAG